jgi:nucleotide sugar dehydrogenase
MSDHYREALIKGRAQIGVWGVGHIGYSTMSHYAVRGIRALGVDVDASRVEAINSGRLPVFAMDYWLGFDPQHLYAAGMARCTTDWRELISPGIVTHFIAIPTERDGKPYDDILADVCLKLTELRHVHTELPPLIIVESTLTPNSTDELIIPSLERGGLHVGRDVLLGVAPRRDWFTTPDRSLPTLPRVFGGTDARTTAAMRAVLGLVCAELVAAPDHLYAEIVKSVENAYRHMDVALANQLSLAYPHMDMRKVLELVGTKWNMETYFPSFGVGGYCIPLSSLYVLQGAPRAEALTLLRETLATTEAQPRRVAEYVVERGDIGSVGIIGLSYSPNQKVWAQSPTLKMIPVLQEAGILVKVHDPHYTSDEIRAVAGVEPFSFPEGLAEFEAVLLVAGHREYTAYNQADILPHLGGCRLILDNTAIWSNYDFGNLDLRYAVAGGVGWLDDDRQAGQARHEARPTAGVGRQPQHQAELL